MSGQLRRPVPPYGAEHALRLGRARRRRRRARLAGTAVTTALAVAFCGLALRAGPDRKGLDVTREPAPRRTPAATAPTAAPRPRPRDTPPADVPWPTAAPLSRTPSPSATRSPARPADGGPVMAGPGKSDDFSHCPKPLLGLYCAAVTGPTTLRAGVAGRFTYWACRHHAAVPETVRFATRQEAEFAVIDTDGRERWRWSRGWRFPPQPHELLVEGGYCYTWTIEWPAVDKAGKPLPPGKYVVAGHPWADEWRPPKPEDPKMASLDVQVVAP